MATNSTPTAEVYLSVLRRFRKGELTKEEAEAELKDAGFSRGLEYQPDPARHDPLKEHRWTLPMTFEWILSRSIDRVRVLMESFRAECLVWRPAIKTLVRYQDERATKRNLARTEERAAILRNNIETLERMGHDVSEHRRMLEAEECCLASGYAPPEPPQKLLPPLQKSMFDIFRDALDSGKPARQELFAKRDDLVRRLKAGDLQASGIRPGESSHSTIPPIIWETITSIFDNAPGIQVDDIGTLGEDGARYHQVRVEASRVREIWPEPVGSIKAVSSCRRWLCEQMRASLDKRPKSKPEFRKEALDDRFAGLTPRGFDQAWKLAIEDSGAIKWTNPGAPKKTKTAGAEKN